MDIWIRRTSFIWRLPLYPWGEKPSKRHFTPFCQNSLRSQHSNEMSWWFNEIKICIMIFVSVCQWGFADVLLEHLTVFNAWYWHRAPSSCTVRLLLVWICLCLWAAQRGGSRWAREQSQGDVRSAARLKLSTWKLSTHPVYEPHRHTHTHRYTLTHTHIYSHWPRTLSIISQMHDLYG